MSPKHARPRAARIPFPIPERGRFNLEGTSHFLYAAATGYWWPAILRVDLPIRLWSNACSPIVEAHVISRGHGHDELRLMSHTRHHAALVGQPNGNGASRSLGVDPMVGRLPPPERRREW
eukprot:5057846-Prymnesium_polylepis.1